MRAVVLREFGPVESLALGELPDPVAGPGEVVVAIKATAVNYVDLLVIGGSYQFLPERPFAPGKLPVGEVAAVGPNVSGVSLGERVLTLAEHGGYAERIGVPAGACIALPPAIGDLDAAALALAYDTAWFALKERARLQAGETVLVLGASGAVGTAATQLAKAFGATVLAGITHPETSDQVWANGADAIVDLSRPNLRDALREQVRAATGGRGADVVLDPLGGDYFGAALRALAWRGRLVVIGFAGGAIPSVKANYLLVKNIEVSGLQVSDYRKRTPALMAECFRDLFALVAAGKLRPPPHVTYPLERFADALRDVRDRRTRARVILTPG